MDKVIFFDTTLRDGEQAPGFSMNVEEKVMMARQLQRLGVDIVEAGFPIASDGDFQAVKAVANEIRGLTIAGLARTNEADILRAAEALEKATPPRIHVFIATSDIHLERKLKLSRRQAIERAVNSVRIARKYVDDVEFSAEDATRSDRDYLCEILSAAIQEGARVINVPDTVGYTVPQEFSQLIRYLKQHVKGIEKATISVHCHNDLGLAVANSLAALEAGARQVECTVNGIGERAGNASLEEIAMGLRTRKDRFGLDSRLVTQQIVPTSKLLTHITGIPIQPNKAIVGSNAFAHEAGIHQDGVLKDRRTYEIMTPESVGLVANALILGKHSGRRAFKERLVSLGYDLPEEEAEKAFAAFKALADKKKVVYDEDLEALVLEEILRAADPFNLRSIHFVCGTEIVPTACVEMEIEGRLIKNSGKGDGPVDAAYKTIAAITKTRSRLLSYSVNAVTKGAEAMGEVTVQLEEKGLRTIGRGAHTDILVASAKAFVNALNRLDIKRVTSGKRLAEGGSSWG